jgi:thiazole synthase ThiGH ThiG subunit
MPLGSPIGIHPVNREYNVELIVSGLACRWFSTWNRNGIGRCARDGTRLSRGAPATAVTRAQDPVRMAQAFLPR